MNACIILQKISNNSLGTCISIRVDTRNGSYPERLYSGYSKREAERRYREEFNLTGRRLERYDWTNEAPWRGAFSS